MPGIPCLGKLPEELAVKSVQNLIQFPGWGLLKFLLNPSFFSVKTENLDGLFYSGKFGKELLTLYYIKTILYLNLQSCTQDISGLTLVLDRWISNVQTEAAFFPILTLLEEAKTPEKTCGHFTDHSGIPGISHDQQTYGDSFPFQGSAFYRC